MCESVTVPAVAIGAGAGQAPGTAVLEVDEAADKRYRQRRSVVVFKPMD